MNESTNTISDITTFYLPFHPSPPDRRRAQGADLFGVVVTTLKFSNKTSTHGPRSNFLAECGPRLKKFGQPWCRPSNVQP